jgi:hypothetical protein
MATTGSTTRAKPRRTVPVWYLQAARAVPAGILAQYLLAGLSLFQDAGFWA